MSSELKEQLINQLSKMSLKEIATIIIKNKIENQFIQNDSSYEKNIKFTGDLQKLKPFIEKQELKGSWRIVDSNLFEQLLFPVKGNINFYKTGTIVIQSVPIKLRKSVENKIIKAINLYNSQNNI